MHWYTGQSQIETVDVTVHAAPPLEVERLFPGWTAQIMGRLQLVVRDMTVASVTDGSAVAPGSRGTIVEVEQKS